MKRDSMSVPDLVANLEESLAAAKAKTDALILRNEVRRLLGEGAPEVSDEQIDLLGRDFPRQPRAICDALYRAWRAS